MYHHTKDTTKPWLVLLDNPRLDPIKQADQPQNIDVSLGSDRAGR